MMYITGDTHMPLDRDKLGMQSFPQQANMSKSDYVLICGDFGGVWDGGEHDKEAQDWVRQRPFTTLFIDGNHENHDLLDAMPIENWNGGKVHMVGDSIIHLMRGQVYTIDGKTIFTMGGAYSIDKPWRREGISWWSRELPDKDEYEEAMANLDRHGCKVDYIITHTAPLGLLRNTMYKNEPELELNTFLEKVNQATKYKRWYFGHFHKDMERGKYRAIYRDVIAL